MIDHHLHRRGGDRGITAVLFAISITALLAVASLVLGGSTGYTAVRSAQNAVDAASLAATSTLREVALDQVPAAEVEATAVSVAEDNGVTSGSVDCDVVTFRYAVDQSEHEVVGPCSGSAWYVVDDGDVELVEDVAGVRVTASDRRDAPLGAFVESETITARAAAAATMQPVGRGGIAAPFMLCANADDHGVELLVDDPSLDPPYRISDAAIGIEFLLWSNGNGFGDRNCGLSPWHGLVNTDHLYRVPSDPEDPSSWWDINTGSRVGHIPRLLAGNESCVIDGELDLKNVEEGTFDDCVMALPLCVDTEGSGTNARFHCVRMATFKISYAGDGDAEGSCVSINKKVVCGRLLPGGVGSGGQGSLEDIDPREMLLIKLVE